MNNNFKITMKLIGIESFIVFMISTLQFKIVILFYIIFLNYLLR